MPVPRKEKNVQRKREKTNIRHTCERGEYFMEQAYFRDIHPDIKGLIRVECYPQDEYSKYVKHTYTNRLFVALSGEAAFTTDGKTFMLRGGSVLFMPPCQPYRTCFHSVFCVRQVCFDFFPYRADDARLTDILIGDHYDMRYMGVPTRFSDTDAFDHPFVVDDHPELLTAVMTLYREYEERRIGYVVHGRALLEEILLTLCRAEMAVPETDSTVGELLAYINAHCGENLTREALARQFHYHPHHINRLIRQATGMSLHHYISEIRIRRSTEYLRDTTLSITEIAHMLSFCDSSYFSAVFQKYTGLTPKAYRRHCCIEGEEKR